MNYLNNLPIPAQENTNSDSGIAREHLNTQSSNIQLIYSYHALKLKFIFCFFLFYILS